ncbi:MAG: Eco57I restriction-modification methylase domain-containing protein [Bacteroidaceae bacterium]|nr:Eco57I restriction-modification methylase domain-containing protein [Bacteroidaceae bacterium]
MTAEQEKRRKEQQDRLDAAKTQLERNQLGQFSTPHVLALDIMEYARSIIGHNDVSFIEPSIGMGAFYSAFNEAFGELGQRALGFEIDPHYLRPSQVFWKDYPIELRQADFLAATPGEEHFDLLVANPPYVRHHHIKSDIKQRLQVLVLRETGIRISGLAGLYCYFLMLASRWLKQEGLSCWLIPSEFMDVNYGEAVKRYLLQNVDLMHIHRFRAEDLQFTDALVSSCIVIFKNAKPEADGHAVTFSMGGSIRHPDKQKSISSSDLQPAEKWTPLFESQYVATSSEATLGDFFMVKRGIATGDNEFFIIDQTTIDRYSIPQLFLQPVLPSPRYVQSDMIDEENGLPVVERRQFLFTCNLPESVLKERYPTVWQYIEDGRKRGVCEGYICSRRTPWYFCEQREPAAIVMPYMGRGESANRLFRFILNTSKAVTTNVYLLLYPKVPYRQQLQNKDTLKAVWKELNAISPESLCRGGRFYGGGLRKMEPRELMKVPAGRVAAILASSGTGQQLQLFV